MHARTSPVLSQEKNPILPILLGGLIAGALDITYAIVFSSFFGVPPIRILQSVASGLLGPNSFKGGVPSATLGLALHFFIALSAAFIYYAASRKLPLLTDHAVLCGLLYGIAIYVVMNYVVLPLSAAPKFRHSQLSITTGILVHMFFIGLPIALAARHSLKVVPPRPA